MTPRGALTTIVLRRVALRDRPPLAQRGDPLSRLGPSILGQLRNPGCRAFSRPSRRVAPDDRTQARRAPRVARTELKTRTGCLQRGAAIVTVNRCDALDPRG
jgi:hypothetical protein